MKRLSILFILIFITLFSFSQKKYTINGFVKDEAGEELIGATIYIQNLKTGTVTNVYGFYSITLIAGEYIVDYSYMGYEIQTKEINLNQNHSFNITLIEVSKTIDEVVITAERKNENVVKTEMSTMKLQAKDIKRVPALFGEVDVIKTLQLLPGVQATGEGFSGNSEITIFDIQGHLILQDSFDGSYSWDGSSNTTPVPSGTYFAVVIDNNGNCDAVKLLRL